MSDLKIKYGLFNLREERELARGHFEYIANDIVDIRQNYVKLGFHLHEFKYFQYYEDFGYEDFYEFVEANFGLDKSAVSRCISVWYRFADYDSGSSSRKMWLSDKWKDYSYSQLCEMLPLDDGELKAVSPEMTVKQIREYKKSEPLSTVKAFVYSPTGKYLEGYFCDLLFDGCGTVILRTRPEEDGDGGEV